MNADEWMKSVPPAITNERLWTLLAHRLVLFMSDIAWHDLSKLVLNPRTRSLSDRLYRAVGSIGANIAEGYAYSLTSDFPLATHDNSSLGAPR
ncbi:MAG: hypothetical protein KatS3mg052_0310 [Candidatus Roseilinea sp.]|nr:MAG: hypothetical protein KatS3mg052_0310 [Candidatus Roseilinea sp.]